MTTITTKRKKLTGIEKIAIFLIAIGSDYSAKLLKNNFSEQEIEQITYAISQMVDVTPALKDAVIEEFLELEQARTFILQGGIDYAREILEKSLGHQKSVEIIKKLTARSKSVPFSILRKTDPKQLINFIQNEHPQTIALILSYLDADQGAIVLSSLPTNVQTDIAKRIAVMDRASPEILKEVEKVLESKLSSIVDQEFTQADGISTLVDILNKVDRGTEKTILEELEEDDAELVDEIRKKLFVFEDIINLDDISIQRILRDVDSRALALALKGSNEKVQERIYKNMSKRAGDLLKDELKYMGPVRLRDVEESQQKIVNIIRNLEEAGEIIISRGGEDAVIM